MKPGIHPTWYPDAQVICACGNTWTTGATVPVIRTDVCSKCHPFFTGEQRIVDKEGQVDRFMRRLSARDEAYLKARAERAQRRKRKQAVIEVVEEPEEILERLEGEEEAS
jgi:large subunit ribosomal protein L31